LIAFAQSPEEELLPIVSNQSPLQTLCVSSPLKTGGQQEEMNVSNASTTALTGQHKHLKHKEETKGEKKKEKQTNKQREEKRKKHTSV